MQKSIWDDQNSKLYILLIQTRDVLFKLRQRELSQFNLSNIESGVLSIVDVLDPASATPTNIANYYFREPHVISRLLTRMERKGLISKKKDLRSKNQIRVEITEKGKKALEKGRRRKAIKEIMSVLSDEQCKELESILILLLDIARKRLFGEDSIINPVDE